jgi:RNA polymerase primary sigma factor
MGPRIAAIVDAYRDRGPSPKDLECEGVLGLVRAMRRFDETAGVPFNTYAEPYIHQAMRGMVDRYERGTRPAEHS